MWCVYGAFYSLLHLVELWMATASASLDRGTREGNSGNIAFGDELDHEQIFAEDEGDGELGIAMQKNENGDKSTSFVQRRQRLLRSEPKFPYFSADISDITFIHASNIHNRDPSEVFDLRAYVLKDFGEESLKHLIRDQCSSSIPTSDCFPLGFIDIGMKEYDLSSPNDISDFRSDVPFVVGTSSNRVCYVILS